MATPSVACVSVPDCPVLAWAVRFGAVAAFPFAAAAAGAGVVAASPGVLRRVDRHQLGGCLAGAQQHGHGVHGLGDVVEEVLVAGAQVIDRKSTRLNSSHLG